MPNRATRSLHLALWAGAVVGGVVLSLAADRSWGNIALWATVLALADLVRVPSPSGGRISLMAGVALVALVFVSEITALSAMFMLGFAGASLLAPLWRRVRVAPGDYMRQVAALATLLLVAAGYQQVSERLDWDTQWQHLALVLAAGLAWFIADASVRMITAMGVGGGALRFVWLLALEDWPIMVSLFASAGLFALSQPIIGWWAVPVGVVPYAISHVSFSLLAGSRRTYAQTIRALSRLPEVAALSPEGHAAATSDLAIAMARGLGLHPDDVVELEYAALLHDIGRIVAEDLEEEPGANDVARWGAEIIRQAPSLVGVADQVEIHNSPYRRPGEQHDPTVPINARILRVAASYDRLRKTHDMLPLEALEVLYRGTAYDYDPAVVRRLREVLSAEGELSGL